MQELYTKCTLCPRRCAVNRFETTGFCGVGSSIRLSSVVLHKGEEPPIAGEKGAGAFFFSGCTLGCSYCQNHQISCKTHGTNISIHEFSGLLLEVQKQGGHNVNFVTGTQFVPGIIVGLEFARKQGFSLPVIWNTSGFESEETLKLLEPYIDIYLPDIKTIDATVAADVLGFKGYAGQIKKVMPQMIKPLKFENDLLKQGTIIRHLVLPGLPDNTRQVLAYYAEHVADKALLSLMVQYSPPSGAVLAESLPAEMKNPGYVLPENQYDQILSWLDEFGIDEGFIQEPSANREWLPDFKRFNPFPVDYSEVIWSSEQKE